MFLKKEKKVSYEHWVYLAQSKKLEAAGTAFLKAHGYGKYGNKLGEKAVKQCSDFTAS